MGNTKKEGFFSKLKSSFTDLKEKCVNALHKYVPSVVILFSGMSSASAKAYVEEPNADNKSTINIQINNANKTTLKYRGLQFDVAKMQPEEFGMIFSSNYKYNAVYAPKGKTATIRNATGYGPLLTRVDVLKEFLNSSDKYEDLKQIANTKGINSKAFDNKWMQYDVPQIMKDLVKHRWDKDYQPTFDKLAKAGYPQITYDNYAEPDNFGYTAAVMSCLGQSSRQTASIFIQAKERVDKKLKNRATLGDYIDTSYDIRHEKWGLSSRYFGKDGNIGEKGLNKQIRYMLREYKKEKTLMALAVKNLRAQEQAHETDAISSNVMMVDTLYKKGKKGSDLSVVNMKNILHHMASGDTLLSNSARSDGSARSKKIVPDAIEFEKIAYLCDFAEKYPFLAKDTTVLAEKRDELNTQLGELKSSIQDVSSGVYKIMGHELHIDYATVKPESVGHVYESCLNPTAKDAANSALGLYQFNLNNTMKSLADALSDEFPNLKIAKNKYGTKSKQYESVWAEYSFGPTKERFELRQFNFMWNKFYQKAFDKMTKSCKLPKITLDNYNNAEYRVYTAAMMSMVNQNPKYSTRFMERAYNRVARNTKTGKPDPNVVGLVSYDVRDEAWGKNDKALHIRYMGGQGVIGEKTLCENIMRYDRECSKIADKVSKIKEMIAMIDVVLNNSDDVRDIVKNFADKTSSVVSNDAIDNKVSNIKKYARNLKELRTLRKRVQKNSGIDFAQLDVSHSHKSLHNGKWGKNNGHDRA